MAGISFTVEFDDAALGAQLAALVERMDHPEGFYRSVGAYFTDEAVPNLFATETAPDGTPWAPLSPVTLDRRKKEGSSSLRILDVTGTLRTGINSEANGSYVRIGSPAPQAAVMQFGAAQGQFGAFMGKDKRGRDHFHHLPWGDIPARPFLGVGPQDEAMILRIASDWLAAE